MSDINIAIILGTSRDGARSYGVARAIEKIVINRDGADAIFIDPKEHAVHGDGHNEGDIDPKYSEAVDKADAFFFVIPEYNRSFPGTLKRLFDLEFMAYKRKPAAIATVSTGNFGGVRAGEAFLPTLRHVGMLVSSKESPVPEVQDALDSEGNFNSEQVRKNIENALEDIIWLAKAMRLAKEQIKD